MTTTLPYRIVATVTKQNIKDGRAGECHACPIALALLDRYPDYRFEAGNMFVDVLPKDPESWRVIDRFNTSPNAENFMNDFDGAGGEAHSNPDIVRPRTFYFTREEAWTE